MVYFPNWKYQRMHQEVSTWIYTNPLEQTLTKLHGMMGDSIVEQSKVNEELKEKMYHLEMLKTMIQHKIYFLCEYGAYRLDHRDGDATSSQGSSTSTVDNEGVTLFYPP